MTSGQVILDVAVILVAARIGAALFESLGQPGVIGEIVAGITLGPTILGAFPGDPSAGLFPPEAVEVLQGIGQLGLALFMFQIGWELDLDLVRRRERAAMLISLASVVVPFTLGIGLATYLHPRYAADVPFWPFALFVGAALSLTAFPVLARLLAQLGLSQTPTGSLVLSAAAVDDILGWTALAIALAALSSGRSLGLRPDRGRDGDPRGGRRRAPPPAARPADPFAVARAAGPRRPAGARHGLRHGGDRDPLRLRRVPRRRRDAPDRAGVGGAEHPPGHRRRGRVARADLLRRLGHGGGHPGTGGGRCRRLPADPRRGVRRQVHGCARGRDGGRGAWTGGGRGRRPDEHARPDRDRPAHRGPRRGADRRSALHAVRAHGDRHDPGDGADPASHGPARRVAGRGRGDTGRRWSNRRSPR